MKRLILMMPLIASGCADFAFNSNLDKENFDEYFKPGGVRIYEQNQLADLNYLYLGTVEGESCQADANQAVPNAGEARTLARRRVADMGGNGVSFDRVRRVQRCAGLPEAGDLLRSGAESGRREVRSRHGPRHRPPRQPPSPR